jgi:hypothetical protein
MGSRVTKFSASDLELAEFVAEFYGDPLGFVRACYPWGEPGALEQEEGPDIWQTEFLTWLGHEVTTRGFDGHTAVDPIRGSVSSGHGIGKSALTAWLIDWIMSTRPYAQGTITSNTRTQLRTKTWARLRWWTKLCLTGHWFAINDDRMFALCDPEGWFAAAQVSNASNSESFAGQHAATSTSFYILDEASAIPDVIYDVMDGGLTDGEAMAFLFGNATRNTGKFHENTFGRGRAYWHPIIVDSRQSKLTNKRLINEWRERHGEDSDFFRVRVRGLPPNASDLQFISLDLVAAAQRRQVQLLGDEPLICGLDLSRGGSDECVFRFRRGPDARSIAPLRVSGEQARDSMRLVTLAADVLTRSFDHGRRVHTMFVDATGGSIGGPIADRLRQLGHDNVIDVQFGGESPDPHYANNRAYIWGQMRDWLPRAAIDDSASLETDLTGPGYSHDKHDRVLLESKEDMKERGLDSPDDADALALTFAQQVSAFAESPRPRYRPKGKWR